MATSAPEFQGVILKHTSSPLYCGLYKRRVINTSGVLTTQFYWLPTNVSGTIVDHRVNLMNGTFTDSATASNPVNYPTNYGTYVVDPGTFKDEKMFTYTSKFPFSSDEAFFRAKWEHLTAYGNGARNILITVEWGQIWSSYVNQSANSSSAYARIKELADHALALGPDVKVSFRMRTDLDDGILLTNGSDFYNLFTDQVQDELGNPSRVGYGSGHVSLAYEAGVLKVIDFVKKFMAYFYGLYGSRIYWASTPTSAQNETGYNYENQDYRTTQGHGLVSNSSGSTNVTGSGTNFQSILSGGDPIIISGTQYTVASVNSNTSLTVSSPISGVNSSVVFYYKPLIGPYPQAYDHSQHAKTLFRTTMQTTYGTLLALNASWGENNLDWSTVVPPNSGASVGGDRTTEQLTNVYRTNKGKDWWKFNADLIRSYMERMRQAILDVAPTVKYTLEWGSNTDDKSPLRMSLLVCKMGEYSDMVKTQLGRLSIQPNLALTMDVMRPNYTGKLGTELNDSDLGLTDSQQIEDLLTEMGIGAIDAGARDIIIISDSRNPNFFSAMMGVLSRTRQYMLSGNFPDTSGYKNVNVSIGQQLENPNHLLSLWQSNGGSHNNRINLMQSADYGFGGSSGCQYPLSIYPFQSFCLKGPDIKSYPWTNAEFATPQDTATLALYRNSKVRFLAATHPIVYTGENGDQIKCNWRVVGASDGITYISNRTTTGWKYIAPDSSGYQPSENNNHPDRRYTRINAEDAVYYLPNTQSYIVYITNTGTLAFSFIVEVLNFGSPAQNKILRRQRLTPEMGEQSYTVLTSAIQFNDIKQFKINCNRNFETDSDPDINLVS